LIRRTAYLLVALPLVTLIALLNVRAHCPGDLQTTIAQLQFLSGSLDRGAASQMQRVFPEGYVFTWALYGLASAQAAGQLDSDDPRRAQLLHEAHRAVRNVESDEARVTFSANLDPPLGAFYSAWSLYARAAFVRAAGPNEVGREFLKRFEDDCRKFADALARSESPFLSSYSASAWPADTAVGIAALGIHDKVLSPRFGSEISRWAADVRTRLDHELGAIAHAANARTEAFFTSSLPEAN
jgi:hypothetical protein